MTQDQIKAYNETAQMIMDMTGCDSDAAALQIEALMGDMLAALNNGVLAE